MPLIVDRYCLGTAAIPAPRQVASAVAGPDIPAARRSTHDVSHSDGKGVSKFANYCLKENAC
jgi:hypothetical protein